ncbi:hypothetical protein BDK51DRAFT_34142 [Blyttiomyces helicus]|uniref:Large ribosomal subunit protein bL9 C-terminal domain-containing protein n=1 Tax=Blyttiomyces helicus TaxID=388810 RepID=A0A4P9VTE3_9FUNG|nr:hypothetical protein BDK51DRAFT_34142 [Blyttiomyces helicus]|eukprot:RKO82784.1 hypothetical protein BDK51DRAFT_34142 [Blyttiomyces helicus]
MFRFASHSVRLSQARSSKLTPILPPKWESKRNLEKIPLITPAILSEQLAEKLAAREAEIELAAAVVEPTAPATPVPTIADPKAAELERQIALSGTPPLVFNRVRITPDSTRIYGSVSVEDIVAELGNRNIVVRVDKLFVEGGRLKEIGEHLVVVKSSEGLDDVRVRVTIRDFGPGL